MSIDEKERLRRWRLVLGKDASEVMNGEDGQGSETLQGQDLGMDNVLEFLYNQERSVGMGKSSPRVSRWLGDIRTYFPKSTVQVMQKDALEKLNLTQMLLEPELLELVEPDVHMVVNLLSLSRVIPEKTKDTARAVVRKVVEDLERKLANPLVQAVRGSLNRAVRNYRPKPNEIDWNQTIRANLKNYLPEKRTIIAEKLVGHGRKSSALRDIVLCVDQSGSMGTSVVYSGIFGAVLASIRAVSTRMVVYDTSVVDLTEDLKDPVDLLFGVQLGGGNDTPRALRYCKQIITRPASTIFVLISDLYEGAGSAQMLRQLHEMVTSGTQVICLLALNDTGAPIYDQQNAQALTKMGVPVFACTPDLFPDMMAAAIQKQDLTSWAARNDIVAVRA
ncbi:MAG TPA: VWA domain-containing protein [Ktedonobacteraceae bacterium]|nr:VWA domain-containing protein [Ktedonobacteraceae bacterium]